MDTLALAPWAVAVAVMAFSVAAKLADWPTTTAVWPVPSSRILAPAVVVAVEIAVVAAALVPAWTTTRFALVAVLYAGYAVAALALRGRSCGCFGARLTTTFTLTHAVACALLAVAVLAGAVAGPGVPPATITAAVAAVVGMAAGLVPPRKAGAGGEETTLPLRPELIDRVVVIGSTSCSICTGLWDQRAHYEAYARVPVEFRMAESEADQELAGKAFPAAVGLGADGSPVSGPMWGIAGVRDMLRATAHTPSGRA